MSVETWPVTVPILSHLVITSAKGSHSSSPFCLVKVVSDDGIEGFGEVSCTPGWSGEDGITAAHMIERYLAPALIGVDLHGPAVVAATLDRTIAGNMFTKAGLEMAVWDLWGKRLGRPIHELLGGPTKLAVKTKFSLTAGSDDSTVSMARWAVDNGFTAMKVKVAIGSLADDIKRFEMVRDEVGQDVMIGVDANGGWSRGQGLSASLALEAAGAAFIEQPLPADDMDGMAAVRRALSVPLVADESVGTPEQAAKVIAAGAADVLSIYVGMAGGFGPAMSIAAATTSAGLGWTIGSNMELGVAASAHLQLAFGAVGIADDLVPCDIISRFYYADDLVPHLPIEAGVVYPPARPGLGAELNEASISTYRSTGSLR